jgi:hypothetical protein
MGSIHEKNQGPKILYYCTFKGIGTIETYEKGVKVGTFPEFLHGTLFKSSKWLPVTLQILKFAKQLKVGNSAGCLQKLWQIQKAFGVN